jgi:diketogulonate reductase-like aldo/keto reductase
MARTNRVYTLLILAIAALCTGCVGPLGRLIDTASTYGDAETVLGHVIASGGLRDKLFIATKLEAPDAAELKRSLARLKTAKVDLLQLHNVRSTKQSLASFRDWKERVGRHEELTPHCLAKNVTG